jgi:hypothetical protein
MADPCNQYGPGIGRAASIAQIELDLNLGTREAAETAVLGALWDSYCDKALIYPRLQDLYTRRQVCWYLLGGVWAAVDWKNADSDQTLDQFTTHLKNLHGIYNTEIIRIETMAAANRPPFVGQIQARPSVRNPGMPGATDPGGSRARLLRELVGPLDGWG